MPQILLWLSQNYIEVIGAFTGIIGVWLTARQIIWCWPIALINVVIYIYVFFVSKLYADFGLQLFYFFMTLYGWYNWHYGGTDNHILLISRITLKKFLIYFLIGMPAVFITGYLLKNYSDAAYPYWDSFVSVWGIIGTYMMAKKIIEHWILWIIVDFTCVGIYFYKGLYATTVLYFIFIILAVYGLSNWKKDYKIQMSC
jgi:nicotinamide mononucleotide transporter